MFKGFKSPEIIVLASRNSDKIKELQSSLSQLQITLRSSLDFPELEDVEETLLSLEGNAYLKASYTFNKTGLASLADDTGLEVDALDGKPGVFSARYAGENASYNDNVDKLLSEMKTLDNRRARFRTALAFVNSEATFIFQGVCEGVILSERQGEKGFGYDPIFLPDGKHKTFAELSSVEKNEISHRGKAISQFIRFMSSISK